MSIKLSKLQRFIVLIILLAGMNVFLLGTPLIMFAFCIVVITYQKIALNSSGGILIAFSFSYIVIVMINSVIQATPVSFGIRTLIFPCCYLIAYSLFSGIQYEKKTTIIEKYIVYIAVFMAAHSIVSFIDTTRKSGLKAFSSGRSVDFWSGTLSTATGQASYYFFIAAILPYILFSLKNSWRKYALLALYGVSLFHDIMLGGRTFIGLSIIAIFIGGWISARYDPNRKKYMLSLVGIGVVVLVVLIIYSRDGFGIKSAIEGSYFYHRFFAETAYRQDVASSARWEDKLSYLQHFLEYPFGGNHLLNEVVKNYSHELWLDTFDTVGWIPFALLWAYTILAFKRMIVFIHTENTAAMKVLIGSVTLVSFAAFFMEPILVGCPMFFAMFCFYDGMLSAMIKKR